MTEMVGTFSTAQVCQMENQKRCNLNLQHLSKLMATNRNESVLKYYWTQWRNVTGAKLRSLYPKYVALSNEAAQLNGYNDKSALWLKEYEVNNFQRQIGKRKIFTSIVRSISLLFVS